jgi:hypothetical protein
MGVLTLADFRDELIVALKNEDDITTARLNRWINNAYTHLCTPEVRRHQELQSSFQISLVAGQNVYPIDRTTIGFHTLGITEVTYYAGNSTSNTLNRWDVRPRDLSWFNTHKTPSAAGGPRHYLWRGTNLTFSPIPTSSENGFIVNVDVWREAAPLVNDGDTTVLTNYWDEALILGAQWIAEYRLGLRELAIATQQVYVRYINEKASGNELQYEDTGFQTQIKSLDSY